MKYLLVFIISLYQLLISPLIHSATGTIKACRYEVTCSEYAKKVIKEKGVLKGSALALKRVASCHPFAKEANYNV